LHALTCAFNPCAEIIRAKLKTLAADKPKRARAPVSSSVLPAMVVEKTSRTGARVTLAEASLSSALIQRQMANRQKARPTAEIARTN
jgi:hypothetical protein